MLSEADRDLAQAKAAAAGSTDPAPAARLAQARPRFLAGARTALSVRSRDVATAFGQARDADKIADDTVAALRTAAEQSRPRTPPACDALGPNGRPGRP